MLHVLAALFILLLPLPEAFAVSASPGAGAKANRLLHEASPYLRQHAYNPIDWYAWGEEAFAKAKKENKPVFLSIGYSTCHWCHVMARESFSDAQIAEILNASFIAIKVDRERRPDVDETYMLATQLITGAGGWPNSVFLTPDRKPFYAGTYFPPDAFRALLSQVSGYWLRQGDQLRRDADKLAGNINSILTRRVAAAKITPQVLKSAGGALMQDFDMVFGGFGGAPKFPQESTLLFLLRLAEKDGDKDALHAAAVTLDAMLRGGIQDQAGGGFHRYAVDKKWLVPHFEKMLYNQALITQALVRAYLLTGQEDFAAGARRALDYVLDDMTSPEGGFYSARDADSEGEEGVFYVWTPGQLEAALGKKEAGFAAAAFGVSEKGNFENGRSVLHLPLPAGQQAKKLGLDAGAFNKRLDAVRKRLVQARGEREAPHRDEKIVAAWNGMMIAAFAEGAQAFGEQRYATAALNAGNFMWQKMRAGGELKRAYFEGVAALDGQQEDHAFGALGFIALYDLTGGKLWLERAETLMSEMVRDFRDDEAGDYYMTAALNTFGKVKARTDAGTPSGNAAALQAFARLARRSANPDHTVNGEALLAALSGLAVASPQSSAYTLMAADELLRGGAGLRQYLSRGVIDARAALEPDARALTVTLNIADGWHINSNTPFEDFFIATELSMEGAENVKIIYPAHKKRQLGFHDKELAVFEGEVKLKVEFSSAPAGALSVKLRVQACSDEICLEPETAVLRVPVHVKPAS